MAATPDGKAVSARNATRHGVFAREVVLPHLGEDPAAYATLLAQFVAEIKPRNLAERQCVERIAAASWRLHRVYRWQAQISQDPDLTEDERLLKLDRVLRHETTLTRQIDRAVRLLGRETAQFFERRAHRELLSLAQTIEPERRRDIDTTPQDTTRDRTPTRREQGTLVRQSRTTSNFVKTNCRRSPFHPVPIAAPRRASLSRLAQTQKKPKRTSAGMLSAPLSGGEGPGVRSLWVRSFLRNPCPSPLVEAVSSTGTTDWFGPSNRRTAKTGNNYRLESAGRWEH